MVWHGSRALYPISLVYGAASRVARMTAAPRELPYPVVSVGNITWGGTGKTPVVIRAARDLAAMGRRPAVLTRGYRRKGRESGLVVSVGGTVLADPDTAGDEPLLLAQSVPEAAVIVGPDRYRSGMKAVRECGADVFVLDDGFQHWRLRRKLDIICVNALNPFGNGCLIPAGILREPAVSLKRADLIIITNSDVAGPQAVEPLTKTVARFSPAPVATAGYRVSGVRGLLSGERVSPDRFAGADVTAFSALGENRGFIGTLGRYGMNVVNRVSFRDHHWYTTGDLAAVLAAAPPDVPVMTTAKDAVKLDRAVAGLPPGDAARVHVLETDIEFYTGSEEWERCLRNSLPFS